MFSFSELVPILLNVLIGIPQMLSSIQMILICVGVSSEILVPLHIPRKELTTQLSSTDGRHSCAEYVL